MRSFHYLAFAAGIALATACGGDGGNGPANTAPTANFTASCTDLDCTFTDLSSDSDGSVDSYDWTFGDGGNSSQKHPAHSYTATGSYDVTLTVTDNDGDTDSFSGTVDVVAPAGSNPPTAAFGVSCSSLDCTFTDESTDPDGTLVDWDWDFENDGIKDSDLPNPAVHHYDVTDRTVVTVKLTVTDDQGLTSTKTTQFTVSPPATLTCNGAACTLGLDQASTVRVTLTSRDCTAQGNLFRITAPVAQTLFTNGCYEPAVGTFFDLNGGAVFAAGTQLEAEVISGSTKQEIAPALRVTGSYATGWTLEFDDGEDATPPEPDFDDLVITVTATPTP